MNIFDDNAEPSQLVTSPSGHQVLARKWRPRNFQQMVGQEPVMQALINALDSNRLHHAYLFTGTRGIGKTTISRILAKCLNCIEGVSANPCGNCQHCRAIDQGQFVDLIEVDAASRTKVEDTRELLDNVQYLPTQGRYKVYLIDEVHMLSGHSFNALLKTLEEPPAHVKFLLATTDPQRLPITILSRCLQFHLKRLTPERIATHLAHVLQQESVSYDPAALSLLGKAADGSMRDALSLLDQAIAYSKGNVSVADIHAMLGSIEQSVIWDIIAALTEHNAQALMACCAQLADDAADFSEVLAELLSCFHQIAVVQALPTVAADELVTQYATRIPGEELQLYYQIGLIGQRDLPLAPTSRIGFEMVLLRMLCYQPTKNAPQQPALPVANPVTPPTPLTTTQSTVAIQPDAIQQASQPTPPLPEMLQAIETVIDPIETTALNTALDSKPDWSALLPQLKLSGLSYTLASHCLLQELTETQVTLVLDAAFQALLSPKLQQNINDAFNQYYDKMLKLVIHIGEARLPTPAALQQQRRSEQHQAALTALNTDPNVQQLIQQFDATLELSTIKLK